MIILFIYYCIIYCKSKFADESNVIKPAIQSLHTCIILSIVWHLPKCAIDNDFISKTASLKMVNKKYNQFKGH